MKKITVLKALSIHDPGHDWIRWVTNPLATDIDFQEESNESLTLTYNEGRRQTFRYATSERKIQFVVDSESDVGEAEDFMRRVYEMALNDVAEMMGTTKDYLYDALKHYNIRKRGL